MYLKEIKSKGFKSFADKTTIELTKGLTGIVGPNGSGKSNVVDAVRWVLGEQSVKSLRGDGNMTDVIFSGSKSRNPMNTASVTLVFDNTDRYIPLEYDEIEIKRRVYKDDTNEYFINNEKSRLKDITNLLLDSGMAKESFNIISQGKVDNIIASKPEEKRIIIEEAAGVLKYKRRKETAIRKLEKTHDNLNRVGDIINELEPRIAPLKEQKEKAIEYTNTKQELEKIEIALVTEDITNLNYEFKNNKDKIDKLNDEILKMSSENAISSSKTEKYKNSILNIEEKINKIRNNILELTTKSEKLNSRKTIITERKSYDLDNNKLHNHCLQLKENALKLKNDIDNNETDTKNINKEIDLLNNNINKLQKQLEKEKNIKEKENNTLTLNIRKKQSLKIKAESLQNNIENGNNLPAAVKSVLNNPKLRGIHDIIGNLIETEDKYSLAISTALGYSSNNIVTDNETTAKEAINYIKTIGRATFFPLNIIKPKEIDESTKNILKGEANFIDIASNLVKNDTKYNNIIQNQLGNIIITTDLDSATKLSKKISNRYRIVTLDGEIIHVGGSMTGGKNKQKNTISEKYELEITIKEIKNLEKIIEDCENKINEIDYNLRSIEDKLYLHTKEKLLKEETIKNKQKEINELKEKYEKISLDIKSTKNIMEGTLSKEEEEVLNQYYSTIKEKEQKEKELDTLIKEKKSLNEDLEEYELSIKKENNLYNQKLTELKDLEILNGRMDVKLDNLLNILNETYSMTYEKAKEKYYLEIDYTHAKSKVNSLKRKLKEIGIVNLAAPEEYEKISERYNFLINQVEDLKEAENTLLKIIDEMDKIMIKEFNESFKIINENFKITFKELFGGGDAKLKLTEPNNLLETGVEIIASPPGKKLNSISALSGGEKTLTAISLLFAIIKSRPAPFCILDEVEAALDDANVDTFGQYITKLKNKSQFILITHKKKTMEYVDVLYGITMQESGVSKLVSVKLEDIEKTKEK
ncbi:MAG: AAA family ATPase [Bacilli bacterium]|nr:AAA family ATPase [Bacilli bacterium]